MPAVIHCSLFESFHLITVLVSSFEYSTMKFTKPSILGFSFAAFALVNADGNIERRQTSSGANCSELELVIGMVLQSSTPRSETDAPSQLVEQRNPQTQPTES